MTSSSTSTAATRTRSQGERSRERILDAAERLMTERGYAATGISAICRESGLPASSLYWHFESKEGLLAAVLQRGAERLLQDLVADQDRSGTPVERLSDLLLRGFEKIEKEDSPGVLRLTLLLALERSHADPATVEALRRVRRRIEEVLVELLGDIFRPVAGDLSREIAEECASFAMAFADGCFVANQIDPDRLDAPRLARQLQVALIALGDDLIARRAGR